MKPVSNRDVGKYLVLHEDEKLSSSDEVVEHINSRILAGQLVPGQRLVENDLTRELQVSRGPVREAFRRLDALGVLARTLHRGAVIRALSRSEVADLLVAIEPLAGLIARLAGKAVAARSTERTMKAIEEALRPYLEGEEDPHGLLTQRRHFYEVLISIGGNSQLPSLLPTMRIHLLRLQVRSFVGSEDRKRHVEDYAVIARAVLAGDPKQAEKQMYQHMRQMTKAYNSLPDTAFPRDLDS